MANETIFQLITILLLGMAMSIGGYFRRKADREGGQLRTTEGKRLVIVLRLLGLVVVLPLVGYLINPVWVSWAQVDLPDWLRCLGALSAFSAVPLLYWIFTSIGNNISPTQATRQGHKLITHGPYRWVRHPLYSVGMMFIIAITLLTGLWWVGIGSILPMALLIFRIRREEANLIAAFGDEYRAYQARTRRLIPFIVGKASARGVATVVLFLECSPTHEPRVTRADG